MKVPEDAHSGLSQVVTHSKSEHSGFPILSPHAIVPDTEPGPRTSDFPLFFSSLTVPADVGLAGADPRTTELYAGEGYKATVGAGCTVSCGAGCSAQVTSGGPSCMLHARRCPLCDCGGGMRACFVAMRAGVVVSWACLS
jgi:hypothetical protein